MALLGQWPAGRPIAVVGSNRRVEPAWDGRVYPALGVSAPDGAVLSVPPDYVVAVRLLADLDDADGVNGALVDQTLTELLDGLPSALDLPGWKPYRGVFRWSVSPAPLPDAGVWVSADDPTVPEWLRPFGGEVLIAWHEETGEYLAGVGIKRHDAYGNELSVGTVPAARGRGLARRLVAQAARHVLDEGAVPTYQHDPANLASARVADAAGFPDRHWTSFGVFG